MCYNQFNFEEGQPGVTFLVSGSRVLESIPESDLVGEFSFGHYIYMVTETPFFPYPESRYLVDHVIEKIKDSSPNKELLSDDGLEYIKTRCDYLRNLFCLGESGKLPDYIPLDIPNNLNQKYKERLKKDYEEDYKRCLMLCE